MQVIVFYSAQGGWGFTPDDSGDILPADLGPWKRFKIINMHRGEEARIAVNTDRCLDAIAQDGYYLAKRKSDAPDGVIAEDAEK